MQYKSLHKITTNDIQSHGIPPQISLQIHQKLTQIIQYYPFPPSQTWKIISKQLLNPYLPFSFHQMMYYGCYCGFCDDPLAWLPDLESARLTNVGQLLERHGTDLLGPKYKDPISSFSDFQQFSVRNPEPMACSNPETQFLTIEEENAALKMKQVELEGRIRYLSDQLANLSTRLRVQRGDIQPPPSSRSSPMVSSEESDDQSDHSYHSRPRTRYPTFNTNDFKVDIPEYDGRLDPDAFLEWLQTVERVFDYKTVPDSKKVYWKIILEEMGVSFTKPPECILRENSSFPGGQWLPGCLVNPAKICLSLNSKRNLNDIAVVWRDEGEDDTSLKRMTLAELRKEVWSVSHALSALNFPIGTAIAINMPMNVKSVIIYLAIVLTGNIVVSIADSFAPGEIATRLRISKAKAIFTQDTFFRGGKTIPLYRRVVDAKAPTTIVIPFKGSHSDMKLRSGDISWHDFLHNVNKTEEYKGVDRSSEAFTNILFSSGTTGEPKAIPWTNATPFKAAADGWCHMDIRKGDIVIWPTNLGWMMGPWLVYASLLNNATIALYNGSPLGPGFAKFVQDAKVTMLGVVPSIVRAWKSTNCTEGYDWSSIRCFGSTGEASSVDEYLWLMGRAYYKPVIEYCGGTEIGGGFVSGSLLQAQVLAAFSTPAMGCELFILDNNGVPLPEGISGMGELALGPLMFGASHTLLNGDHYKVYFEGMPTSNGKVLRRHGDVFERTSSGYYRAHGRADDTMNLGGIKVSSVEIERICNKVDDTVLETAAIGVPPSGGGPEQLIIAVVFRNANKTKSDLDLLKLSFNSALQKQLNPLFRVSRVVSLPSLPRTATNKVMRRVLRQQLSPGTTNSKM